MTTIYSNIPDIAEIKSNFEAGDKPTEQHFYDLIELAEVARTLAAVNSNDNMEGLTINDQGILAVKKDEETTDNQLTITDQGLYVAEAVIPAAGNGLGLSNNTYAIGQGNGITVSASAIEVKVDETEGNQLISTENGLHVAKPASPIAGSGINIDNDNDNATTTITLKLNTDDANPLILTSKGLNIMISDDLIIEDLGDENHQLAINWTKIWDNDDHPLMIKINALGLA